MWTAPPRTPCRRGSSAHADLTVRCDKDEDDDKDKAHDCDKDKSHDGDKDNGRDCAKERLKINFPLLDRPDRGWE